MLTFWSPRTRRFCLGLTIVLSAYGASRLYFVVTDGFALGNIAFPNFENDPRWEIQPLEPEHERLVSQILAKPFHYLGKGCQSYVFASEDGNYVLKFFKYHRYRVKPWVRWFSFIPFVAQHRAKREAHKDRKRLGMYEGWKVAYEHLSDETGVLFVHLNSSENDNPPLLIHDKMGFSHEIDPNQTQFLIQKRAEMLCPTLNSLMSSGQTPQAKELLDDLLALVLSEFSRGFADHDHALMQNTGVYEGKPMHVDVGQFSIDPTIMDEATSQQELFNKTYKFRLWLREKHPILAQHLDNRLLTHIGQPLYAMSPTHLAEAFPPIPRLDDNDDIY